MCSLLQGMPQINILKTVIFGKQPAYQYQLTYQELLPICVNQS